MPVYTEALKITRGDNLNKSLAYLKGFANSIEKVAGGKRDPVISKSKGNIESIPKYKSLAEAVGYLEKHLVGNEDLKAIKTLLSVLEQHRDVYRESYKRGVKLIMFEYEAAASMVVRGVSFLIATGIDIRTEADGRIVIAKASKSSGGIVSKTLRDMAAELSKSNHGTYLNELLHLGDKLPKEDEKEKPEEKVEEKVEVEEDELFLEGGAGDLVETIKIFAAYSKGLTRGVWNLGSMVIRTAFGIIPLIRSAFYLWYKRKADTIQNLETQAEFVQMNIDQLKNIKGMDPAHREEIIKKQQGYVEAYKKKAEKLRAELIEEEKDASAALKDEKIEPSDELVMD